MSQTTKTNTDAFEQGIHIFNEDKLDPLFKATQRIFKDTDLFCSDHRWHGQTP